ncbi:unnamed protein product, partial [Porites evermanni]
MAGITKRVGEIGVESIHTFPETGERPCKVQAKSLTKTRTFVLFTGPEEKEPVTKQNKVIKENYG